ncbi:hypothetical protein C8R44DRAFT_867343 [Mycena epipterygia]|nr:hypothetical protein C8R44DRAFT_867343 [Mycena epipterygia]
MTKIFRVSKATLAARSIVFQDMLVFAPDSQHEDGSVEMIDGCPVVLLHDSPAHVEAFLKAIFDSTGYVIFDPRGGPSWYNSAVLQILHLISPSSCSATPIKTIPLQFGTLLLTCPAPSFALCRVLDVTAVATEVGAQWLLPVAYYHASVSYEPTELLSLLDSTSLASAAWTPMIHKCIIAQADLVRFTMAANRFLCTSNPLYISRFCYRTRLKVLHDLPTNIEKLWREI